ncbi:MAG: threonylcarbamoyl-AMP synthase [Bacteroidetes bacterium]|nr:threonylcarbamoyl-AMP synthase [Bacteroidota bacterium]
MTNNCPYLCQVNTRITQNISIVIKALKRGNAVGIPTETVYGLAANALHSDAVKSIYDIKTRPTNNPLILHFYSKEKAQPYIAEFHEELALLEQAFSPGPITFLVPKTDLVPDLITAGLPRVAIRFPSHPMLRELLSNIEFPIAAPSANKYGAVSPTQAIQVKQHLDGAIPFVLDGGPCAFGLESTIVGMEENKVIVYRHGSIALDDLSVVLGYVPKIKNQTDDLPITSGMVKYHYAPKTPLRYFNASLTPEENIGYLFFSCIPEGFPAHQCILLSDNGDQKQIARNLYRSLIEMDAKGFSGMYIEKPSKKGLGLTLLDRLNRATAKFK